MPELPDFMHNVISHGWPLIFILLILVIGKKFFEERPKIHLLVLLSSIPLVVWGPDLFKVVDEMFGRREGKIYTYMSKDFREFEDSNGRKIEATILDVFEEKVVIRRSDGRVFENKITIYSPRDQKYILNWGGK